MEIRFILIEPARPENVGGAARALKNMGFNQLAMVGSSLHQTKQARIVAHGAEEVLAGASQCEDLRSAVVDCDLVIGTSAKPRHQVRHHYCLSEAVRVVATKGEAVERLAIVFGREESGIHSDELALCDLVSYIPMAQSWPSLNLAQAVLLYAHQFAIGHLEAQSAVDRPVWRSDPEKLPGQYRALKGKLAGLLLRIGIEEPSKLHRWALSRLTAADEKDLHFLHALCDRLDRWGGGKG